MVRKRLRRVFVPALVALATVSSSTAHSQVLAPSAANDLSVGAGTGQLSAVSPTGTHQASLPISLPAARGRLPVPFQVVYTGSTKVGAAGAGWDIPLSSVRVSSSTWHRKPGIENGTVGARVVLTLNGASFVMLPSSEPDVYVPMISGEYMELRRIGSAWALDTSSGLRYVFRDVGEVGDRTLSIAGLWVLTSVHDKVGGDRVELRYSTGNRGCGSELDLDGLSYAYDADGDLSLYDVELQYTDVRVDEEPADVNRVCNQIGDQYALKLSVTATGEHADGDIPRSRVLRQVIVRAKNNLVRLSEWLPVQTYLLGYSDDPAQTFTLDPDTDLPRLRAVDMRGEGSSGLTLPLARYEYGALTSPVDGAIHFGAGQPLPRSARADAANAWALAGSSTTREYYDDGEDRVEIERVRSDYVIRDFTGDSIPDLVFREGGHWVLEQGILTAQGPTLDSGRFATWSQPAEIFVQETRRFVPPLPPAGEPQVISPRGRAAMITTETLTQFVDWNGDGRLDVVDTAGGSDLWHWRVWLNRPDDTSILYFEAVEVDVRPFIEAVEAHGVLLDFLGNGQPTRFALERSRTWPRIEALQCVEYLDGPLDEPWTDCTDLPPEIDQHGVETVVEWTLLDVNDDSYPDLIGSNRQVYECEAPWPHDPPEILLGDVEINGQTYPAHWARARQWLNSEDGNGACDWEEYPTPEFANTASVLLNTAGALATAAVTQEVEAAPLEGALSYWSTLEWDEVDFARAAHIAGLGDLHGLGSLRHRVGQVERFRLAAGCGGSRSESRQSSGLVDLNGDGLPDLMSGVDDDWVVSFGTSAGFASMRAIVTDGMSPQISSSDDCGSFSPTDSGLLDVDGDGKPEILRVFGGSLYYARLRTDDGEAETHHVGRLVAIENGHGAVTRVRYGNAKVGQTSSRGVPAPELVVRETSVDIVDGSGTSLLPTRYAYGGAEMRYDPIFDRFSFAGYRRSVTMTGASESRSSVAIVVDHVRQSLPGEDFAAFARGGRIERVSRVEGVTGGDPAVLLSIETNAASPSLDPRIRGQTSTSFGITPLSLRPYSAATDGDCFDVDVDASSPAGLLCWNAAVVGANATFSWRGSEAPLAGDDNVVALSAVTAVDALGRPIESHDYGDLRTWADDTCTAIEYAVGTSTTLSAVSSVHVDDCGWTNADYGGLGGPQPGTPIVLAGLRYRYDDLAEGQVVRGLLTSQIVENYDVTDGSLLGAYVAFSLDYDDQLGVVREVSTSRQLGGAARRVTTIEHDAFGMTATATIVDADGVLAGPFVNRTEVSTWPSIPVSREGLNGEISLVHRDSFGRLERAEVEADGIRRTVLERTYADEERHVTETRFPEDASRPQTTHVFADALGRMTLRQVELGADYGGATIVTDLVTYDELGRVRFRAAPFESAEIPFVAERPEMPDGLYGVTMLYDLAGRVIRTVEAMGVSYAVYSSVPDDTYVTSYGYSWLDGQAVSSVSGPRDNDPTTPFLGAMSRSTTTAIGLPVEDVRIDATGTVVDRVQHAHDRLGSEVLVRRYRDPQALTGIVDWQSRYDSAGRTLRMEEPGASPVTSAYDEWGALVESRWLDGSRWRIQSHAYDALGRLTRSTLEARDVNPAGGSEVEWRDEYSYDEHSGALSQQEGWFLGRLSRIRNDVVGDAYFSYDQLGRTTFEVYDFPEAGPPVTVAYSHTLGGLVDEIELESAAGHDHIRYQRDSAARTRAVVDVEGGVTLFDAVDVDALGRHHLVRLGNGVVETATFAPDGRQELTSRAIETSAGTREHIIDGYDAGGRILGEQWTGFGTPAFVYQYDVMGRLIRSAHTTAPYGVDERFTYDGLGNLQTKRNPSSSDQDRDYVYDPLDLDRLCRLDSPGAPPSTDCFAYDGAGNVVLDTAGGIERAMAYDSASRIVEIVRGDAQGVFVYGPGGALARTRVFDAGELDHETWSLGAFVEVHTRSDGATQVDRRILGPQGIVATLRSDGADEETIYVHGDRRANRYFTRADGTIAQSAAYRAFGAPVATGVPGGIAYTDDLWNGGDDLRELGVDVLGARIYDPAVGRFLQRDPIVHGGSSTLANPYAFSINDPVNFSDPTGLSSFWDWACPGCGVSATATLVPGEGWVYAAQMAAFNAFLLAGIDTDESSPSLVELEHQVIAEGAAMIGSVNGRMGIGLLRGGADMAKASWDESQCVASNGPASCPSGSAFHWWETQQQNTQAMLHPKEALEKAGRDDWAEGVGYYAAPLILGEIGGTALNAIGRNAARLPRGNAPEAPVPAPGSPAPPAGGGGGRDFYVQSEAEAVQRTLPATRHGDPIPDVDAPHTQLGRNREGEPAAREWMTGPDGRLTATRRIDFTDHGTPDIHPYPHQHLLTPNNPATAPRGGYRPGRAEPLEEP